MHDKNSKYFEFLKKEIVNTLKLTYPAVSDNVEDWKGQTITFFQEDLLEKVNEHISERWFYNHMKSTGKGLPRIDMLNLLSRYAGYSDWQEFTYKHKGEISSEIGNPNRVFIMVPLIVLLTLVVFYTLFKVLSVKEYQFCFVSADDLSSVISRKTQIEILDRDESPKTKFCDSVGCVKIKTDKIKIRFVVKSPYYKTDTIERVLKKFTRSEMVKLHTNDYALMIHYFSTSNVDDWKKRKEQLDMMFADSARIYEVFNGSTMGIELYDKQEFINKLTVPTGSLKQIEILDTKYVQEQIVALRFIQKKVENGK